MSTKRQGYHGTSFGLLAYKITFQELLLHFESSKYTGWEACDVPEICILLWFREIKTTTTKMFTFCLFCSAKKKRQTVATCRCSRPFSYCYLSVLHYWHLVVRMCKQRAPQEDFSFNNFPSIFHVFYIFSFALRLNNLSVWCWWSNL